MPSDDVAVFISVLQALEDVGILSDVVIVGGWAQHLYRRYINDPPELSAMRTVDIDILLREKYRVTAFELAVLLSGIPEWRGLMADRFRELPRLHRPLSLLC